MIDNYDSFTYNIVQYIGELGYKTRVVRSKEVGIDFVKKYRPDRIIISPGPGWPESAGISIEVVREVFDRVPILGVCLGHQCIAVAFGGKIVHAKRLMHGKVSAIYHKRDPLFARIPQGFVATRYHSLVVDGKSLPKVLKVIAETEDGEIMAIRHRKFPVWGVQFHPESILTEYGKELLSNFIHSSGEK